MTKSHSLSPNNINPNYEFPLESIDAEDIINSISDYLAQSLCQEKLAPHQHPHADLMHYLEQFKKSSFFTYLCNNPVKSALEYLLFAFTTDDITVLDANTLEKYLNEYSTFKNSHPNIFNSLAVTLEAVKFSNLTIAQRKDDHSSRTFCRALEKLSHQYWRNGNTLHHSHIPYLNLAGANLAYLRLHQMKARKILHSELKEKDYLEKCSMTKTSFINLRGANLSKANLTNSDLSTAQLSWCNLSEAVLKKSSCYDTNFSYANLQLAKLELMTAPKANFSHSNLTSASARSVTFDHARLFMTILSFADLTNSNMIAAEFESTLFHKTLLQNVDFFSPGKTLVNYKKLFDDLANKFKGGVPHTLLMALANNLARYSENSLMTYGRKYTYDVLQLAINHPIFNHSMQQPHLFQPKISVKEYLLKTSLRYQPLPVLPPMCTIA